MIKVSLACLAIAMIAVSCGGSNNAGPKASPSPAHSGTVTLSDFAIAMAPTAFGSGSVTFSITNNGPSTHEFVVFKSDLALDKLPLNKDKTEVDEEGAGIKAVDEKEDIASGATTDLTMTLEPGSYVGICNVTGHYGKGMRVAFTVS